MSIKVITDERVYHLVATTAEIADNWVKCIEDVRLKSQAEVRDLELKLEEEDEKKETSETGEK